MATCGAGRQEESTRMGLSLWLSAGLLRLQRQFGIPLATGKNSGVQSARICEPWYTRSKPSSDSDTVSIGEIQKLSAPGASSRPRRFAIRPPRARRWLPLGRSS